VVVNKELRRCRFGRRRLSPPIAQKRQASQVSTPNSAEFSSTHTILRLRLAFSVRTEEKSEQKRKIFYCYFGCNKRKNHLLRDGLFKIDLARSCKGI
jgi:hypothetical protein